MEKPTILYVDDEPINTMVFYSILKNDFNVITANSGPDGLEKLKEKDGIAFVVSDMRMPLMNGIEFITEVKNLAPTLPCIILTAYETNPEIQKAIDDGLILHSLKKPLDREEIKRVIMKEI